MGKEISLKETNNHAKLDLLQAKKHFQLHNLSTKKIDHVKEALVHRVLTSINLVQDCIHLGNNIPRQHPHKIHSEP